MGSPKPWPRLSQSLRGTRAPGSCQACSGTPSDVDAWEEHDESDRREGIAVLLCLPCSKRLIDPHPRLYRRVQAREPFPGLMDLCTGCRYRSGVDCGHPDLKRNGGAGLVITFPQPVNVHVNRGRGRSGWENLYMAPPRDCAGRADIVGFPTTPQDQGTESC